MRKRTVDSIDALILNRLSKDANITNKQLSEEIGLSAGATLVRVQNLWKNKIFKNYQASIAYDFFKFKYNVVALMTISPSFSAVFRSNISKQREVIYASKLSKENFVTSERYFLHIMCKSKEHLDECLSKIKKNVPVHSLEISEIEDIIKDEALQINAEEDL